MKKKLEILAIVFLGILAVVGTWFLWPKRENVEEKFVKTDYLKIDLTGIEKLMIVAHPDDDILWGGNELIKNDYLVVCITCGSDERRVGEFETVMGETDDKLVMLGYPDKTNGKRDNWDDHRDNILEDLEKIYELKDWKFVLTHNPEGEYGHAHHKMTNVMVSDVVDHDRLNFFGKYHSKKDLEENDVKLEFLDEATIERKKELLLLYETQKKTLFDTFGHIWKSENVVSYDEWMKQYEEK